MQKDEVKEGENEIEMKEEKSSEPSEIEQNQENQTSEDVDEVEKSSEQSGQILFFLFLKIYLSLYLVGHLIVKEVENEREE